MIGNKKIIIPALALAVVMGAGSYGIYKASADENSPRQTLIEKIASRFNLDKSEVTKVFDEERQQRDKEIAARSETRLSEAVSKGELTAAQKELILAKMEEVSKQREANRDADDTLTAEERRNRMEEHRAQIEKWAQDNGIDTKYLMMGIGKGSRGFHEGQGRGMGRGL